MSDVLEMTGFLLSLAGWLIIGATLPNNYWKFSTVQGNVITISRLYENLWKSCTSDSTGISNCKIFDSLLSLPAYIQACRALMIIAIVLGLFATVISLFGLKCTKVGSNDERKKAKIALAGGLNFIVAGLCSMVAISWYAAIITAQFFDPLYVGIKYELGSALYLGWAGSLLAILGGAFLCCSYKGKKKPKPRIYMYDYTAAQNAPSHLKVKRSSEITVASKAYV
ncbi:claudin-10-like [Rhinatrema bivittatum]|uniref:claudin-10-like n=1 Tax=Rhinatrema bivittatum TaxID=194408 RepID=UPI0011283FD7|nr:claudin-10-like [Rhinatrema bivittatum]